MNKILLSILVIALLGCAKVEHPPVTTEEKEQHIIDTAFNNCLSRADVNFSSQKADVVRECSNYAFSYLEATRTIRKNNK